MITFKEFLKEATLPGTYAAVRPSKDDMVRILAFANKMGIPNIEAELHVTLLYSRKNLPNYTPDKSLEFASTPKKFEIWPTKSGMNCLVLTLDSPALQARHKFLMDEHDAEYDFDKYKVHISLSYDVGDFDILALDVKNLPSMITLTDEYTEELDLIGK